MKSVAAFLATILAAPLALACPGAHSSCGACSVGFGGYVSAMSVGLLIGVGSVAVENLIRSRKR